MKIIVFTLVGILLLSGCASEPVYETIGDVWENTEPVVSPGRMEVPLPEGAEMEVLEANGDGFYRVGDWELWTKVLSGGDLKKTLAALSGMDADSLTVIDRNLQGYDCHETTWTVSSEDGIHVVRAGILDDGNYHYCLCVSVPEEEAGEAGEVFSQILQSVTIRNTDP